MNGDSAGSPALLAVLAESKRLGFLGPGPVGDHIVHAARFLPALDRVAADGRGGLLFADLGAGGGLPSLPILVARPRFEAVLIDAIGKRGAFLIWALTELGLTDRALVWTGRAEEIAHEERARFRFDAVVARGFGPPAMTVECGAPLLRPGGCLLVSEPPGGREWPAGPLATLGLTVVEGGGGLGGDNESEEPVEGDWVVTLRRTGTVPEQWPRRIKVQQRDPLFR